MFQILSYIQTTISLSIIVYLATLILQYKQWEKPVEIPS